MTADAADTAGLPRPISAAAQRRLATYGTLAPGRQNHHHMAAMHGRWFEGTVRGNLQPGGWGSALGYPGIVLDPAGAAVGCFVFESSDLPAHWPRLDAFEGSAYQRVEATVFTADGPVEACIYELAPVART